MKNYKMFIFLTQAIGVHKQYLDVMGPIFCQALRPILQAEGLWDNDVRTAWLRFFRIISHRMKGGYLEGINKNRVRKCFIVFLVWKYNAWERRNVTRVGSGLNFLGTVWTRFKTFWLGLFQAFKIQIQARGF
jgi:hypothetical protein